MPDIDLQILSEVSIDCGCATVAEVRKRGDDFWCEFEFYLSDLIVGMVLDVVLVTLLAPVAVIGAHPKARSSTGVTQLPPLLRTFSSVSATLTSGYAISLGPLPCNFCNGLISAHGIGYQSPHHVGSYV
jgi:hypothetical protein